MLKIWYKTAGFCMILLNHAKDVDFCMVINFIMFYLERSDVQNNN